MYRKESFGSKVEGFLESLFWTFYILYIPVSLLFIAWMLFVELVLPLF